MKNNKVLFKFRRFRSRQCLRWSCPEHATNTLSRTNLLIQQLTILISQTKEIKIFLLGLCRNLSDVLLEAISNHKVLSLYQGLGTKNLQSFLAQFVYFYGYSYFKRLYLEKSGSKYIGTKANLIIAAAAGACTALLTQVRHHWLVL